jgi:hypothetical protein
MQLAQLPVQQVTRWLLHMFPRTLALLPFTQQPRYATPLNQLTPS